MQAGEMCGDSEVGRSVAVGLEGAVTERYLNSNVASNSSNNSSSDGDDRKRQERRQH